MNLFMGEGSALKGRYSAMRIMERRDKKDKMLEYLPTRGFKVERGVRCAAKFSGSKVVAVGI